MLRYVKIPEDPHLCWEWEGSLVRGYASMYSPHTKNNVKVSRLVAKICLPDFSHKLYVCHRCDNKKCVNPKHLFMGTNSDNMLDAVRKKRHAQSRKTKCPRGHLYTDENTLTRKNGHRTCKICAYAANAEYSRKRREHERMDPHGRPTRKKKK